MACSTGRSPWVVALCQLYLAQEGALLLLTGHQLAPPEPQLSHQPLHTADIHRTLCFHVGCRWAKAGQGLTLVRSKGQALLPPHLTPKEEPRWRREWRHSQEQRVLPAQGVSVLSARQLGNPS